MQDAGDGGVTREMKKNLTLPGCSSVPFIPGLLRQSISLPLNVINFKSFLTPLPISSFLVFAPVIRAPGKGKRRTTERGKI